MIGHETPLADVELCIGSQWRKVALKLESHNPSGSIKYRTARSLVIGLEESGKLGPGAQLVESTSGNLGVALAMISAARGYHFTAVTDPKTDPAVFERIKSLGGRVVCVSEPDAHGSYLTSRIDTVRQLLGENPNSTWPNQYENASNPAAHYQYTGPEIYGQCPDMDAVFIAVSTGGTLAGVARYLRSAAPSVKVIGVDVRGSQVFGAAEGKRILTGIGSSRRSSFLRPSDYDDIVIISDREAVTTCHLLQNELGIGLGGSGGAVVAACGRYLDQHPEITRPVCICADGRSNYLNTLYDKGWLAEHGLWSIDDLNDMAFSRVSIGKRLSSKRRAFLCRRGTIHCCT